MGISSIAKSNDLGENLKGVWASERKAEIDNFLRDRVIIFLVRRFLNNIFEPKPTIHMVPKKIICFCFPFTHSHTLQIRTQITRLCNAAYPHLNIRFVFRSSTRISSFFPFKDKVPKFLRSGVVYLFKCQCCSASYVGQTTCHLHTRISEHLGITPITGKPSSSPVMSSIFSHLNTTGHSANFDDFKILSSCSDSCELMNHESLLISKLKPSLNVQGSSIPLNLLYYIMCCFASFVCIVLSCTILHPLILYFPYYHLTLIKPCKYIIISTYIFKSHVILYYLVW